MGIEWGALLNQTSDMAHRVLDNTGSPSNVMTMAPFQLRVSWTVPPSIAPIVTAGQQFRVRVFAESIGPGADVVLNVAGGGTDTVVTANGGTAYSTLITVDPASSGIVPEGAAPANSGMYQIGVMLRHLVPGGGYASVSGISDDSVTVLFRP